MNHCSPTPSLPPPPHSPPPAEMPASVARNLSSLFRPSAAYVIAAASTLSEKLSPPLPPPTPVAGDEALKQCVSLLDDLFSGKTKAKKKKKSDESERCEDDVNRLVWGSLGDQSLSSSSSSSSSSCEDSASDISSVLCGSEDSDSLCSSDTQELRNEKSYVQILQVPWFSSLFHTGTSQRRKELSRDRKVNFKNTVSDRCSLLVTKCAEKLGPDATIEVLGRVGRATGLKEYNALIRLCIETGRKTEDEDIAMEQYYKAYQLFSWMKEKGFEIEEQTYGPFLMYLIDMHMKEEFYHFLQLIKDANSFTRFGYYEMLLSIETEDEDKIHELLSEITLKKCKKDLDPQYLVESYLMALCERDRKKELLELLEVVDIAKLSLENIQNILRSLGRLSLQSVAKKFILTSLGDGGESEQISDFICSFATSMANLAVRNFFMNAPGNVL